MTLLAPLTTALIGVIGGIVLIALYSLRSRRRIVMVSSVRNWPTIDDDTQASEPFRLPRASWLLFLHLLILGLFALAAGRPLVNGSNASDDVVMVIDCSASMGALTEDSSAGSATDSTRFALAVEEAVAEAERVTGGGGRVAIIRLDGAPQLVQGFSDSVAAARSALGSLLITDEAQRIGLLTPILDGLLAGSGVEAERARRVLLIDDRSAIDPALNGYPVEHRSVTSGSVARNQMARDQMARNIGIVRFAASRSADSPGDVRVLMEFAATREGESVVAVLSLDGTEIERFPVSMGETRTARKVMTVAAARGLLTLTLPGGDALPSDDSASMVIVPQKRVRVALVRASGPVAAGVSSDPGWLLEETLRALPRADVQVMSAGADLAARVLAARVDVVVADGVVLPAAVAVPQLVFGGRAVSGDVKPDREAVVLWDREEPLLADLSLDGVFGVPRQAAPADAIVIARSLSRPLVWRTDGRAGGRIDGASNAGRRIGVAFVTADTNWPLDVSFPVFVSRAVDWLAGIEPGEAARAFKAGAVVDVGNGPVRVRRAGVVGEGESRIAVNVVDRGESALEEGSGTALGVVDEDSEGGRGGRESQKEIWSWFVAAAAALLMVEWIVFGIGARVGARVGAEVEK